MTFAAAHGQVDVFLRPGEYSVGDRRHRVRTVLGSCVSVTLWCPLAHVGAMSHFLLASRLDGERDPATVRGLDLLRLDARYGDEALRLMLHELARLDVGGARIQAKIFGGGNMFPDHDRGGALAVGRRNGEAARSLLRAQGIELVSESLFGAGHRQIVFDIDSGDVWARQLPPGGANTSARGTELSS